jgi:hypothetical protein
LCLFYRKYKIGEKQAQPKRYCCYYAAVINLPQTFTVVPCCYSCFLCPTISWILPMLLLLSYSWTLLPLTTACTEEIGSSFRYEVRNSSIFSFIYIIIYIIGGLWILNFVIAYLGGIYCWSSFLDSKSWEILPKIIN